MKIKIILGALACCLCVACTKSESLRNEGLTNPTINCEDRLAPRVESSKAGALQFDPSGKANTFNQEDLKVDADRYWGDTEATIFTIPFAKASKLLQIAPDQAVSLVLTDLEDPTSVDADWVLTDQAKIVKSDACMSYFNLDKDLMDSFEKAIRELDIAVDKQTINAHIGRSKTGKTVVYFMLGVVELHAIVDSGRGPSNACGAKIPPKG